MKYKIQRMSSNGNWVFVAGASTEKAANKIADNEWGVVRILDTTTGKEI